jgi:hypothetical protein
MAQALPPVVSTVNQPVEGKVAMGSFATHFLEEIGEQVEQVEQVDTKK